jgi:uncharacterized repeat protein (TIGR01451 family)
MLVSRPTIAQPSTLSTEVGGSITDHRTWDLIGSPYVVTETISIDAGGALTVEAGVVVSFQMGTALRVVDGPLRVLGEPGQPAILTADSASPDRGFWTGLAYEGSAPYSELYHCVVEYATIGLSIADVPGHTIEGCTFRHNGSTTTRAIGAAIDAVGDNLNIANNEVYSNDLGLRMHKSFNDVITGNLIYDNDGYGLAFVSVVVAAGGNSLIAGNDIHHNGGFGLGLLGADGMGSDWNRILNNHIHENVPAGNYDGHGLYLDYGAGNTLDGNLIWGNAAHGISADHQHALDLARNIVRGNTGDGVFYAAGNVDAGTVHGNVLCHNIGYDLNSDWPVLLPAEGNWFGTNTPALGAEISGTVSFTPWISMAIAVEPAVLLADGSSTAAFTMTMRGGGYAVPDGYTVSVTPTEGTLVASPLALVDGHAATTYVAGTVPGTVDVQAADGCSSLLFEDVLTLEAYLDLAVSKRGGTLTGGPGGTHVLSYTIAVSNTGLVEATSAVLTDVLPAGTEYLDSVWSCDAGGVCTYPLPVLPVSGTVEVSLPLRLNPSALPCPIVLTNVVEVADALLVDVDPGDNVFTLTTSYPCLPDLMVVKNDNVTLPEGAQEPIFESLDLAPTQPPTLPCVYVGEVISYLIGYTNWGLGKATDVVLTETLPPHTSYAGGGWTHAGGDVYTFSVGTLLTGNGGGIYFGARVETFPAAGYVENIVRIGGAEDDLDPSDNESREETSICEGVLLEIRKDDSLPCAFPGDEIRYTIVFTNPAGELATGLVFTETLPAHTAYLTTPGWVPLGGGQYAYNYGDLAPYASDSVEFVVIVDDPLPETVTETMNLVCLGYDGAPPGGVCATELTPLPLAADLRVVKHDHIGRPPPPDVRAELDWIYRALYGKPYVQPRTIQQEYVVPGDIYSYTITYLNAGRSEATGVVLTETLPAYVRYVGYGWTHLGGNTYVYDVGALAAGSGGQRNFWVQVQEVPCIVDYLYNWVHIGGAVEECNLANNWSGEETPVMCYGLEGIYLPLITREYAGPEPPVPTPTSTRRPRPTNTPTPLPPYVSDVEVNPDTGLVYVASPLLDAVLVVDPEVEAVTQTVPVGDHPVGLAVVPTTGKLYSANLHSWSLTSLRLGDYARLADIYVGAQAVRVAADVAEARVYAANHLESDNGVAFVDSRTDEFGYYYTRFHATQGRYGIDVDPDADQLFVAARDAGLIAIQDAFAPDQEPQTFKLDPPRVPFVVAFNTATDHLFVTAPYDNKVVVLDPYRIEWHKGRWVWHDSRWVLLVDRINAGWIAEVGVGLGAEEGIAVHPGTGFVYVSNADSDTVSILADDADPTNIHWVRDVAVGAMPQGIGIDVARNLIYIGNAESRDLSVIDGATNTLSNTIPLE